MLGTDCWEGSGMVVRLWQTLSQRLLESVVSVLLGLLFKVLVLPHYFPYIIRSTYWRCSFHLGFLWVVVPLVLWGTCYYQSHVFTCEHSICERSFVKCPAGAPSEINRPSGSVSAVTECEEWLAC